MNPLHADHEHLLDLLVDGELDDSSRRELLLWCERDPEGWRRCALAFLEAQRWSQQLRSLGAEARRNESCVGPRDQVAGASTAAAPVASAPVAAAGGAMTAASRDPIATKAPPAGWWRAWQPFVGPLAMAASFLVAFALGLLSRGAWPWGGNAVQSADLLSAPNNIVARQDSGAAAEWHQGPGSARMAREPLGQVRLVVDGPAGAENEIQLPVVESRSMDADFLQRLPAAVPKEIQQMFEQMGHEVRQRREVLPLRLKDGRRLIVPVDQVEVHPVGNRDYQ